MRAIVSTTGTFRIVDDDGETVAVRIDESWEDPRGGIFESWELARFDDLVTELEVEDSGPFGKLMAGTLVQEARQQRLKAAPVERDSAGQRRAKLVGDSPQNRTRIGRK